MAKRTGEKYFAILDAAIKTIAQHGYHRTRIADIAREASVADGTVYIYFSKKEDVLISLFREMMSRFVNGLRLQMNQSRSANEKLMTIISYHLTTLENYPDQAKVTQIELRQIDQEINEGISGPLMEYFKVIEEVIEEGKNSGLYRQDLDVRMARKVIFGAVDEVVTCWVMSKKPYSLSKLASPVFNLLVRGLERPAGPDPHQTRSKEV